MTVDSLRSREQFDAVRVAGVVVLLTGLGVVVAPMTLGNLPVGLALMTTLLLLIPFLAWIWHEPVRGLYVLFGAAVVLEAQSPVYSFADDIGSNIYFFQDVATWTHIKGISFSVAEVFILFVFLIWILKGIADRNLHFRPGSMKWPLGLYMLMVVVAELHGIGTGGDFKVSLWEVRAQIYMGLAYVMTCNLVKTRSQVWNLMWILIIGAGIKAVQGTYRYRITLGGNLHQVESLFPHEQSFFFNAFLVFAAIAFLYGASRRMKWTLLGFLPFVIVATLANQRRAAILAIMVAFLVLLLVTLMYYAPRRRMCMWITLVLAIVLPPYYMYYQHKDGTLAEPARAIASNFHPDPRDASSNQYRLGEDADIMATVKSSFTTAVVGYGFGKPMMTPYPLANISGAYVFWNIMPHNSILWVWMRLGTVGYILFWFLIGISIIQAMGVFRRIRDPELRGLSLFIVLMIIQEIILGYLDLQWTNYRNLIAIGVLFGLVSRLRVFERAARLSEVTWRVGSSGLGRAATAETVEDDARTGKAVVAR